MWDFLRSRVMIYCGNDLAHSILTQHTQLQLGGFVFPTFTFVFHYLNHSLGITGINPWNTREVWLTSAQVWTPPDSSIKGASTPGIKPVPIWIWKTGRKTMKNVPKTGDATDIWTVTTAGVVLFISNAPEGNTTYFQRDNTTTTSFKRSAGVQKQLFRWNTANRQSAAVWAQLRSKHICVCCCFQENMKRKCDFTGRIMVFLITVLKLKLAHAAASLKLTVSPSDRKDPGNLSGFNEVQVAQRGLQRKFVRGWRMRGEIWSEQTSDCRLADI